MYGRERWERIENEILAKEATHSIQSKGRKYEEKECDMRTCFQRDRDRIIHSKSFRRLKHKTHVFIAPEGDHYRTRLTHTLEVAQIGRTIARGLALNEDLVEAIALGHDLGHTPFGHTGEAVLNDLNPKGFRHNLHSLRVVDYLEHKGNRPGLNLTWEVRDGIRNHSGEFKAHTLEGEIIKIADRIAYINHDIDDAIRAHVLKLEDIPREYLEILGESHSDRIDTMIRSIIESSQSMEKIQMDERVGKATLDLRTYMFDHVYYNTTVKSEDQKVRIILEQIYNYYKANMDKLPNEFLIHGENELSNDDRITDYIAGMTDRFAIHCWKDLFMPRYWSTM